jgi:hypothetical protein
MRKEHLLLVVLLVVVLLLLLAQYVWVKATRKVPPEGCIGGRDTNDGAEKVAGRVGVTRTMVPGTNDQLRRSWRTTGGNVKK